MTAVVVVVGVGVVVVDIVIAKVVVADAGKIVAMIAGDGEGMFGGQISATGQG